MRDIGAGNITIYCNIRWCGNTVLGEQAIPESVLLFEPELWPGHLLNEERFGRRLFYEVGCRPRAPHCDSGFQRRLVGLAATEVSGGDGSCRRPWRADPWRSRAARLSQSVGSLPCRADGLPPPESIENDIDDALARVGLPRMILDLRTAQQDPEAFAWVSKQRALRRHISTHVLITPATAVDVFFVVDRLTPAAIVPF